MRQASSHHFSSLQKFWQSSGFTVTVVFVFIFFVVALSKEIARNIEVNDQIDFLQREADTLTSENQDLSQLLAYLHTDARYEREGRERLGLKKPDESVLVVPHTSKSADNAAVSVADASSGATNTTRFWGRPGRWWRYFFSTN